VVGGARAAGEVGVQRTRVRPGLPSLEGHRHVADLSGEPRRPAPTAGTGAAAVELPAAACQPRREVGGGAHTHPVRARPVEDAGTVEAVTRVHAAKYRDSPTWGHC
jgi:hypothetical protein